MFDLLKKKLSAFAEQVKEKILKKEALKEPAPEGEKQPSPARKPQAKERKEKAPKKKAVSAAKEKEPVAEKIIEEKPPAEIEAPHDEGEITAEAAFPQEGEKPVEERPVSAKEGLPEAIKRGAAEEAVVAAQPAAATRELKPNVSIAGKIRAAIKGEVELEEKDLVGLLWQLELSLLEADVEQTTAEEITRKIKGALAGKKISRKEDLSLFVKKEIKGILREMMQAGERDILKEIREKKEKPYKILFLGPNGAGKTTTIAKLSFLLQSKGLKVIWAAGDTFRAASIEQLEKHAEKLGIRLVKHQYGADPAAVAFDAVKAAQSRGIDCAIIDSAGRQETNKNLMNELQKIVRVAQPDLKVYVGESFTGQALLQQAKEYDKMVGIDAFILTKIDCDSKGGTGISLLFKLRKPIIFVGTGQEYRDLQRFEPDFILGKIIG